MKMIPENIADQTLLLAIQNGEERALYTLYERYSDGLFGFIVCQMPSQQDAEDIWQETWLVAVRRISQFRGESCFFTWLCAIARHKVADYYRKHPHQSNETSLDKLGLAAEQIDRQPLPEEIVSHRQVQAQVLQSLYDLPVNYRRALIARYAEENSVEEIASLFGKSYKATESLLSRARKAFLERFRGKKEV